MAAADVGAVVVGAGIAGLSAALELQESLREVFVIDAGDRPGGVMRTDHVSGYVIERGPNTIQVKAPLLRLLTRLGLRDALEAAQPASRLRFVVRDRELLPVPLSPFGFARTRLLSGRGKLRLLSEPLRFRRDATGETVAAFAGRRFGDEAVAKLVGPFLTGVYAGDENELGAEAVLASLVDLERRFGSVVIGALATALSRRRERGLSGTYSALQGLGPFARRIAERLYDPPALGARVVEIARDGDLWRVSVASANGESEMRAPRIVIATGAREAAELLRGASPELAYALAGIAYAPIVGVAVGVDPARVARKIEGFGFLVPRDQEIPLLGCLFMSQMFPGRAPAGRELLHCMLGGRRYPEAMDLSDDVLHKRVHADLEKTLGLRDSPQLLAVSRWPRAIPQPGADHPRRVAGIRQQLEGLPGLALAGAYLDGVAVADVAASGMAAAQRLSQASPDPTSTMSGGDGGGWAAAK
jgi:oxygen-dependent protoporphyrinogen oxidase